MEPCFKYPNAQKNKTFWTNTPCYIYDCCILHNILFLIAKIQNVLAQINGFGTLANWVQHWKHFKYLGQSLKYIKLSSLLRRLSHYLHWAVPSSVILCICIWKITFTCFQTYLIVIWTEVMFLPELVKATVILLKSNIYST